MRCSGFLAAALFHATVVSPAWSQSADFLEIRQDAERRRQAEQYSYEKEQRRRGNDLNTEKPRGLGEAPPSSMSQPRGRADEQDGKPTRACPPGTYMC